MGQHTPYRWVIIHLTDVSAYTLQMCQHTPYRCVSIPLTDVSAYPLHMCQHTPYICVLSNALLIWELRYMRTLYTNCVTLCICMHTEVPIHVSSATQYCTTTDVSALPLDV
jgi:hypothetical protein